MRGVGHAALHNPSEVNLRAILQSSVIYDQRLRDRIEQSKAAKRAVKRWKKVTTSSMADARVSNRTTVRFNCVRHSRIVENRAFKHRSINWFRTSRALQQDKSGVDGPDQEKGNGDPVLDFKLDLDDGIVNWTWETTQVLLGGGNGVLRSTSRGRSKILEDNVCFISVHQDFVAKSDLHPLLSPFETSRNLSPTRFAPAPRRWTVSQAQCSCR